MAVNLMKAEEGTIKELQKKLTEADKE